MPGRAPIPDRPLVLQAEDLDPCAAAWLAERADLRVCPFAADAFLPLLAGAHALLVRTYTRVDAALLDRAPNLRVVGRAGVGLDRIDVTECRRRGVEVVHTPDANTQAVAEYVFAMLLDALRPRLFLDAPIDADRWNALRRELTAPKQLSELTLGVLGYGKVGSRVGRAAAGFGMRVLYHDLVDIPPAARHGALPVMLDSLLEESDILTLHVDSRPANRRLLDAALCRRLRPTGLLVNTSRGLVVDPAALRDHLVAHPESRALIDVHDPEPFDAAYPLLNLPNCHLSPHLAASTAAAHVNMSWVVRDVWRVLRNEPPEHPAP